MFLKNRWYVAALSQELENRPLGRIILGEPVVLYRVSDGSAAALEDRCVHRQAPLSLGVVVNDTLQCGYHGFQYDRAGQCVGVPGQSQIPPGACVRSYPVRERQGFVFVWPGDPALAEQNEPYDWSWVDQPGWRGLYAKFHARCDHRLLIDNLLDLTHLAFAHGTTIGNMAVAEQADTQYERDGDRVRITRWMLDIPPAPAHVKATGYAGNVDRWQIIEFTPPGFVWLKVGSAKAGTSAGTNAEMGAPDGKMNGVLLDRHSLHAITPATEDTTNYFWSTAHDTAQVGPDQEQVLYEQSVKAFNEDLVILEGQQQHLNPGIPTVDVIGDSGQIQARRVMERLISAEGSPGA